MNNIDKAYQQLLQDILDNGIEKKDRTGTGTISVFGRQIRHNMSEGFPLLTTKKMAWKTMVTELLWFLRGDTNIKYLVDNNCHIWDGDAYKEYMRRVENIIEGYKCGDIMGIQPHIEILFSDSDALTPLTMDEFISKIKTDIEFAKEWGQLGPIYGAQWRNWNGRGTDQIENLINDLKINPDSRRLMVSAWNVGEIGYMTLPPCHYGFQVYTRELSLNERGDLFRKKYPNKSVDDFKPNGMEIQSMTHQLDTRYTNANIPTRGISLMWNQRSVDTGLGWSFNIASYSLLLIMLAKQVNMIPDEIICNLGDVHLYLNHIEPIKEQLDRKPFPLPNVILSDRIVNDISEYTLEDIRLENYQSHPTIKLPLSN